MVSLDEPKAVREGEEIDPAAIEKFLKENVEGFSGKVEVFQFPSGYSNLTYLVRAGGRELILRRPPFGRKAATAHDMSREFSILSALHPVFPYCPRPIIYCEDESVIGAPFYLMERLCGVILRKELPEGMELDEKTARKLCEKVFALQHRLHSLDYKKAGLDGFGKPKGYVKRQVEGWCRRYVDARTPDVPDYKDIMEWLIENQPPDSSFPGLIHNDYKFDNLVLDPNNPLRIIGILDWEMATIGDPLMDFGNSLAYWIEVGDPEEFQVMRLMPTHLPGMMKRKDIIDYYADLSGHRIDDFSFYLCFGRFRLAVIAQQIYYRFYHGQTRDKRFAQLGFAVAILEKAARMAMEGIL